MRFQAVLEKTMDIQPCRWEVWWVRDEALGRCLWDEPFIQWNRSAKQFDFTAEARCKARATELNALDPCVLCGASATGRCQLPDQYDECPHGCSPER